jgi:hypothetical protein
VDARAVLPPGGILRFVTIAFYPTGFRTAAVVTYEYPEVRTAVFAGLTVICARLGAPGLSFDGVRRCMGKPRSQKRDLGHPLAVIGKLRFSLLRLLKVLLPEGEHGVVALNERGQVDEAVLAHGEKDDLIRLAGGD